MSETKRPDEVNNKAGFFLLSSILILLFLWPLLLYFGHIFNNTPYYDEWQTVPDAIRIARGEWSFAYLLAEEQGHPVIFYRIFTLIDAIMFSYTLYSTVFFGIFFLVPSAMVAFYIATSRREAGWGAYLAACLGILSLVFSLHNWENILAPWLINSTSLLFFFIVATHLAPRAGFLSPIFSLSSSALASLSFGNGFLVWPCCIFILCLHRMFVRAAVFFVPGVLFFLYTMTHRGSLGETVDLENSVLRVLVAVGNALSFSPAVISATGPVSAADVRLLMLTGSILTVLACLVAFLARRDVARSSFALSLMLFGFGNCALVAVGRSTLPVEQAASSRYYFSASPLLIGIILILLDLSRKRRWATFALSGCVAVIFVSYIMALRTELATAPDRKLVFDRWAKAVANYDSATDAELANPHWPPALVRSLAQSLSDAKLGPFSETKP